MRETLNWVHREEAGVRAVVLLLQGRFRQHWKAWLALSALVAVTGGIVLGAVQTASRTAAAFPGFVATHGYDIVVYSSHPLPQLARLPQVASVTQVAAAYTPSPRCQSCRKPIDASNLLILQVPSRHLTRMVSLLSGRMPRQSRAGEVLASYTLARDNGVRIGSLIQVPLPNRSLTAIAATPTLRVVGIAVAETEFPAGSSPHYDLYTTSAFGAAVNHKATLLTLHYVRLRHGAADLPALDGWLRSADVLGTEELDSAAAAVQDSIHPQVTGWWALAALAAVAALAVIGQALARQAATERSDRHPLGALGVRPRDFMLLDLLRALIIGASGAAAAVVVAVLLSPLTPVGEPRLALSSPGDLAFDPLILPVGALAVLAGVTALAAWPAARHARGHSDRQRHERLTPGALAAGRAAAQAGLPASALVGLRHALERGRSGQPAGMALLGTAMAVAALCGTAVFGASQAHLLATPSLYGEPFQVYFSPSGNSGDIALVNGPLLDSLRRDDAMEQITLATVVEIEINGHQVQAFAVQPVRGPALLSVVDGRLPSGDREIMLGPATMRATGTRLGGTVQVAVTDPHGARHQAQFRVTGRASLNAGLAGMDNGAALTMNSVLGVQCPPGPGQSACQHAVRQNTALAIMVRATAGNAGSAALAGHIRKYPSLAYSPQKPTALVNFGESVNFPLLFGLMLSLFGAATMAHLLLVSVARRRTETALLKVVGFVRRQAAAVFCWQATVVALAGIAVGVPVGVAIGRAAWRVFATNFGVVPVPVVPAPALALLALGVLAAANVLAAVPALLAARSHPGQVLRRE